MNSNWKCFLVMAASFVPSVVSSFKITDVTYHNFTCSLKFCGHLIVKNDSTESVRGWKMCAGFDLLSCFETSSTLNFEKAYRCSILALNISGLEFININDSQSLNKSFCDLITKNFPRKANSSTETVSVNKSSSQFSYSTPSAENKRTWKNHPDKTEDDKDIIANKFKLHQSIASLIKVVNNLDTIFIKLQKDLQANDSSLPFFNIKQISLSNNQNGKLNRGTNFPVIDGVIIRPINLIKVMGHKNIEWFEKKKVFSGELKVYDAESVFKMKKGLQDIQKGLPLRDFRNKNIIQSLRENSNTTAQDSSYHSDIMIAKKHSLRSADTLQYNKTKDKKPRETRDLMPHEIAILNEKTSQKKLQTPSRNITTNETVARNETESVTIKSINASRNGNLTKGRNTERTEEVSNTEPTENIQLTSKNLIPLKYESKSSHPSALKSNEEDEEDFVTTREPEPSQTTKEIYDLLVEASNRLRRRSREKQMRISVEEGNPDQTSVYEGKTLEALLAVFASSCVIFCFLPLILKCFLELVFSSRRGTFSINPKMTEANISM